jgi:hypothetical protein
LRPDAFAGIVHLFDAGREAFGVVTPLATERAPFKENGDPNARSVVDGIAFDVEYGGLHAA